MDNVFNLVPEFLHARARYAADLIIRQRKDRALDLFYHIPRIYRGQLFTLTRSIMLSKGHLLRQIEVDGEIYK